MAGGVFAREKADTVMDALVRSLKASADYNPGAVARPAAILWTDGQAEWQEIMPKLRQRLPHLLTFGDYDPELRTGPAIWLRSVVDRALLKDEIGDETPIVYLPGIGRQKLRAAGECPDSVKPLVELQYRGTCWTQKNGKDWTVLAFLVSEDWGLGLDVARDKNTGTAMKRALVELATAPLGRLRGKRLEADDFHRLLSRDLDRNVLLWMNEPDQMKSNWDGKQWDAFKARCEQDLGFDPEKDGETVAAERLGRAESPWDAVWERYEESPAEYRRLSSLLRDAKPTEDDLFAPSSLKWPQNNEEQEAELREALIALTNLSPSAAREKVAALEKLHGQRRKCVWAKLGEAPLAGAVGHLAKLVKATAAKLGGGSAAETAQLYADGAWKADEAALLAAAEAKTSADAKAVSAALDAVYRPWLESAAEHLQDLLGRESLPGPDEVHTQLPTEPGTLILFVDGLRYDVSQRLASRLKEKGCETTISTHWAALPTVTATAKPAVSPVADKIKGHSPDDSFGPVTTDGEQALTTERFRKLLAGSDWQYIPADSSGDPAGRGWTEFRELDKAGHDSPEKLARAIDDIIDVLLERIESLMDAGWHDLRLVTDHGWLWLPRGLPKVDLPGYLTVHRWARCAAIKGSSKVEVPTVPWHWNHDKRVATAPGISCFRAGNTFAHGGVSLQECLVPVVQVVGGQGAAGTTAEIVNVIWRGLRCRVRVEATHPEKYSVALRDRVNDPASAVSSERRLDDKGNASVLVAEDELEGSSVVVVLLDAEGRVVKKQPTIIGG